MAEKKTTRKALNKQPQGHPLEEPAHGDAPAASSASEQRTTADVPVQLSFRVPGSIRHRLKVHAAKVDRAQQDIIAEALDGYLTRHGD